MSGTPSPRAFLSESDLKGQTKITSFFAPRTQRTSKPTKRHRPTGKTMKLPNCRPQKNSDEESDTEEKSCTVTDPEHRAVLDAVSDSTKDESDMEESFRSVSSSESRADLGTVSKSEKWTIPSKSETKDSEDEVCYRRKVRTLSPDSDDFELSKEEQVDPSEVPSDLDEDSSPREKARGKNLEFYRNKIKSSPDGDLIEDILKHWKDDFMKLEQHHGYIQWLFPIREMGMNGCAEPLGDYEAKAIKEDDRLRERVLRAYEMMLGFYGLRLGDKKTGSIEPSSQFQKRMEHLNSSFHNNLRITRILKSLSEFGFEHLKKPLVEFLLDQAFDTRRLVNCRQSCLDYWIPTLKSKDDEERLKEKAKKALLKEQEKPVRFKKYGRNCN